MTDEEETLDADEAIKLIDLVVSLSRPLLVVRRQLYGLVDVHARSVRSVG